MEAGSLRYRHWAGRTDGPTGSEAHERAQIHSAAISSHTQTAEDSNTSSCTRSVNMTSLHHTASLDERTQSAPVVFYSRLDFERSGNVSYEHAKPWAQSSTAIAALRELPIREQSKPVFHGTNESDGSSEEEASLPGCRCDVINDSGSTRLLLLPSKDSVLCSRCQERV